MNGFCMNPSESVSRRFLSPPEDKLRSVIFLRTHSAINQTRPPSLSRWGGRRPRGEGVNCLVNPNWEAWRNEVLKKCLKPGPDSPHQTAADDARVIQHGSADECARRMQTNRGSGEHTKTTGSSSRAGEPELDRLAGLSRLTVGPGRKAGRPAADWFGGRKV